MYNPLHFNCMWAGGHVQYCTRELVGPSLLFLRDTGLQCELLLIRRNGTVPTQTD